MADMQPTKPEGAESPHLLRLGVWARQYQRWGRDLIAGVFRHANRQGRCEIRFLADDPEANLGRSLRQWRPDGLILSDRLPALLAAPNRLSCPAVLVNLPPEAVVGPVAARLELDDEAIAHEVADLFMRRGLRIFAYVGSPAERPGDYSDARRRHFVARLRERGASCDVFAPAPSDAGDRGRREAALARWLKVLPKPCGLMCCNDICGKEVLDVCRRVGVHVPEQIAVVSVDDETLFCETCDPPLSSVRPDHEGAGFRAAQLLCEAIDRGRVPDVPATERYGASVFTERASSMDWKGSARLVSAARDWIGRHACRAGLRAADVAAATRVSVRLLHLRFAEVGGRTVREEIEEARLARVCELLRSTDDPVGEIGAACGFVSDSHLKALFRRRFGCTMSQFRTRCRGAVAAAPCVSDCGGDASAAAGHVDGGFGQGEQRDTRLGETGGQLRR